MKNKTDKNNPAVEKAEKIANGQNFETEVFTEFEKADGVTVENQTTVKVDGEKLKRKKREKERRQNLGMRTDVFTLSEALGISPQDVASAMFADVKPRSLEESVFDDGDSTTLGSMITDDSEVSSFDKLALRMAIESLDEEKRRIVYLRYFKDYSQSETARVLGLSQVKVSREEKKIMRLLESKMQ